jgi:hypothetical protein
VNADVNQEVQMPKTKYVVRVVQLTQSDPRKRRGGNDMPGIWLEQLRYMGVINWITQDEQMLNVDPDGSVFKNVFDIHAPFRSFDTKIWSEQNASRMQSFGINAVSAPEWRS